jgi:tetratricopeptide (TPR) repeat protein
MSSHEMVLERTPDGYGEDINHLVSNDQAIFLEREAHALYPQGHPDRALSCGILAISLKMSYESTGDDALLDEAIGLHREAIDLCPQGHPHRALSCADLAVSLKMSYESTGHNALLDEAIVLEREALALRPQGHPDRALSCGNLATSLGMCYEHTGDETLLDEAIVLEREAFALYPQGHPDRAPSCGNLAISLQMSYESTGHDAFLDEAIGLHREAIDLCPQGHPHRALSCGNLALSLQMSYEHTGDEALLDESIVLEREALVLRPQGHSDRALFCSNLAASLTTRYHRTGDETLLDESIVLERESIDLRPQGHPDRALSCANLAASLKMSYESTGHNVLLDEAIVLEREALALRPQGHPHRALSCANLAASLKMSYESTGHNALLDEAIVLEREALALRPRGHPERAVSCGNLANSLRKRYHRTGDDRFLHEFFILTHEAQTIAPVHAVWRYSSNLSWTYLQRTSSFYDVRKAIQCLSHSLEYEFDSVSRAVSEFVDLIDDLWNHGIEKQHAELTNIYQRIISLLPLLANSALDVRPQLLALKGCSHMGSDAFISAVLADESMLGLELLELAQGVIWSQSLYLRDPQLKDVPHSLATEIEGHLQALAVRSTTEAYSSPPESALTSQDVIHIHSSRAYALIRQIRLRPGLERFMLGESFETLCATAASHPVVVLVAARGRYYALIITLAQPYQDALLSLDLTEEDLKSLSYTPSPTGARRSPVVPDIVQPKVKKAKFNKSAPSDSGPFDGQLKTLWHKVVKPVLDRLGLKASAHSHDSVSYMCIDDQCSHRQISVHVCTGAPLVCSASSRYMQRVSTMEKARYAAVTLWCPHIPLP